MKVLGSLAFVSFDIEAARARAAQALLNAMKDGSLRNGPKDDTYDASLAQAAILGFPNRDVCESTMQSIARALAVQAGGKETGFYFRYLRTDDLSVVSTDHCPFCMKDQKELGRGDFTKIPNGIGSIEHRMDLLYQGVVRGEISLARWVELCCTAPARLFGLYPRKGILQPGADADVVIYDPTRRTRLGVATHHMNLDHSAYEGIEVDGGVELVMSRGTVLLRDGRFLGRPGHGRFLPRALSDVLI